MAHTLAELKQMQSLSLRAKVEMTQQRIKDWVEYFGEDNVYVSFSGGKDSTILLHIVRELYPDMKAVFVDTGLEFPEIRDFVKTVDNVEWIKPKMAFKDVIINYGYPMISKEVSKAVYGARRYYAAVHQGMPEDEIPYRSNYDRLFTKKYGTFSYPKYKFFMDAPFDIGESCCRVIKKNTVHKHTGVSITAQMASESRLRTQKWLERGCNAFDGEYPVSNPMAFWTEQDALLYIYLNKIPIASVYGDVVVESGGVGIPENVDTLGIFDLDRPTFKTTACQRTGCVFCGFGVHIDTSRYDMIEDVSNPKLLDFLLRGGAFDEEDGLWKPDNRGLGYWFVLAWINKYGNFNIHIKDFEKYQEEFGNEDTYAYLYEGRKFDTANLNLSNIRKKITIYYKDEWYTPKDYRKITGYARSTVYDAITNGVIDFTNWKPKNGAAKYITKRTNGYDVIIKQKFRGKYKTLEEAIEARDKILKELDNDN